ncbi:MAG TPA: glycosyltransferase [Patescibacteria group bacterium]|nr:glycosyltransferase [Patescibacteria group bacterium]
MKVAVLQQVYKSRNYIDAVYGAIFAQTYPDITVYAQIVNDEGRSRAYIAEKYPQVTFLEPGYNIGFSKGHNEMFASIDADIFQLVNPDAILAPTFVEEIVTVFRANEKVGAVSGKIFQYDFSENKAKTTFDTTGVVVWRSGRGRDRGQHEEDTGQYDTPGEVTGVSGAVAAYRKAALESVKMPRSNSYYEYFDEDFHSYWEDVDLSLRLINQGWSIWYEPKALAKHGRYAGSSKEGYKNVGKFARHHKKISERVKQLNYKNHIFIVVKNFPKYYWQFWFRELAMLCYIIVFERSTLKVWSEFRSQLVVMKQKRKFIADHCKIAPQEFEKHLLGGLGL